MSKQVFITGGSSGIGEGLARAFWSRGASVVVSGRDESALRRVTESCAGMRYVQVDVADKASVARCAAEVGALLPELDCVINNAGIQKLANFAGGDPIDFDTEIDINLKGVLYVTHALLPQLQRRPSRLVQVSSGLGFVPLTAAPIYSATKAALHSFCLSLRRQLAGTSVRVVELIPPAVKTRLHSTHGREPPGTMSLEDFTAAAMKGLDSGRDEVPVGLARALRAGSRVAPGFFLGVINKPR